MKLEVFILANARTDNKETVKLYAREGRRFAGWLGSRRLDLEAVQEYESWLKSKYKANSLTNKITGLNLYLRWKGTSFHVRRPPKVIDPHPRVVPDAAYRALLTKISDAKDRIAVRLAHDTFWSPVDVTTIRKADVAFGDPTIVRKVRRKTGVVAEAIVETETARELRAYIDSAAIEDWLFPGDGRGKNAHVNRTWLNKLLDRYGADFSPRWFRSSGATMWPGDDIKGLQVQGGWRDSRVIFERYRGNLLSRQVKSFEAATGRPATDHDDEADELPGYR